MCYTGKYVAWMEKHCKRTCCLARDNSGPAPGGTCTDKKTNQDEVGRDCGGVCGDRNGRRSFSAYARSQLKRHNKLRAKHNSPKMTLDHCLIADAERYAKKLAKAGKWLSQSDHDSERGNQGENLGIDCKIDWTKKAPEYEDVTDKWYSEEVDYNYNDGRSKNGRAVGHFTQVVWKSSTKLGVGKAAGRVWRNGKKWYCTWAVARYAPQGNVGGGYKKNVEKPRY